MINDKGGQTDVKQVKDSAFEYSSFSQTGFSDYSKNNIAFEKKVYSAVKRAFDVCFSVLLLVVLSPLLLLVCIAIKVSSKGPVIYKHRRIGKNGKPLDVLKFRTMVDGADKMTDCFNADQTIEWNENYKVTGDPRVTKIGKLLRITSMDELPQLINIIRGEMSLVGPRPIVQEELEFYKENKGKFLSILPGLTGYWQAYARNECSYEKRMEMELFYVDNANLLMDIKILFATVIRVISCRGAR